MKSSDVCVVIRSTGERTEELCRHVAVQQVSEENVVVVHKNPFARAVIRTFEVGLDFNLPWTIALDADVILCQGAVAEIIAQAEARNDRAFMINMKVLDKFAGGAMHRGVHMYRTMLFERARKLVPLDERTTRAESYTVRKMEAAGYPFVQTEVLVGIHEYEQYYRDIYAKRLFRAHKVQYETPFILRRCLRWGLKDQDFWIAAWGLVDGFQDPSPILLDAPQMQKRARCFLDELSIEEKAPLIPKASEDLPDRLIAGYQPAPEFLDLLAAQARLKNWRSRVAWCARQIGPVRLLPWLLGSVLVRAGDRIRRWSSTSVPK
jgi:hypothetical protein